MHLSPDYELSLFFSWRQNIKHLLSSFFLFIIYRIHQPDVNADDASDAKLTLLRTSMAWPSSRSKVTTHTHSSQEEKRLHGHRLSPPSASSCRGEPKPSNRFITTGSELRSLGHRPSSGPPSQEERNVTAIRWVYRRAWGLWRPLLESGWHCSVL